MGFCWHFLNSHSNICLLISLLLLSTTQVTLLVEGRTTLKILHATEREADEEMVVRAVIGSRPPRCDRRCISCGRCEAVQVPAVPVDKNGAKHSSTGINSRGDEDSSNYKPMSWKCKCGDMIFNP